MRLVLRLFVLLIFVTIASCDVTDPKKDKPKPEGYQEDIPWPSLADSPWPMFHGNPLGSNRSKFNGPVGGIVEWAQDSLFMQSGAIIGKNNLIYGVSQSPVIKVFALNSSDGKSIWENNTMQNSFTETVTSPLILSDGTLIAVSGTQGTIYAFDTKGEIKWKYESNHSIWNLGISIGKDGKIYFTNRETNSINAINENGKLEWSLNLDYTINPLSKLVFSPDGKTIYIQGKDISLLAFDVEDKSVKWTFGNIGLESYPFVDSKGYIYLLTKDTHSNNKHSLYSLNSNGTIRWAYEHNNSIFTESDFVMSMDYEGTTYFAFDSLCAINYQGKLKWKRKLDVPASNVLLTDRNNNIFVICWSSNKNILVKFDKNGNEIFKSELLVEGYPGFAALTNDDRMIVTSYRWAKNWIYSIK